MFGFLKDKLKKAVSVFSKSAESEVREEQVDDKQAIENAKQEEAKLAKKTKPAAKPVEKAKLVEKKPVAKPVAKIAVEKPVEKAPVPKPLEKKPEPAKPVTQPSSAKKETPKPDQNLSPTTARGPSISSPALKQKEGTEQKTIIEQKEKKGFFRKLFGKKEKNIEEKKELRAEITAVQTEELETIKRKEENIEEKLEHLEYALDKDERQEEAALEEAVDAEAEADEKGIGDEPEEKSGFFGKLKDVFTKKTLTTEKFDELFWELELAMLENNVAVEVIEKIKKDLKDELTSGKVSRMGIEDMITARLKQSVEELFDVPTFDLVARAKAAKKPYTICMIGVNGAGKTTTLAKLVHLLQTSDLSCVVAASDTFRAAAIDQLKEHCDKLGVKLISQGYGADPAAVAFDAIKHAESKSIDVVIIDTAGRLHSNTNLMQELGKVMRVAKPDLKIFIGESITGNDCVEQAQVFNKLVGIDAIILSKADIDEKGGAAISVSYVTGKPILYLGMGQTYDDLVPFDKERIIESLDLD